jgi:uncharacterized membrane protein
MNMLNFTDGLNVHQKEREKNEFKSLLLISNLCYILGWIMVGIAALVILISLVKSSDTLYFLYGIAISIVAAFFGLLTLASGELIKLFIKIEENTRKRDKNSD